MDPEIGRRLDKQDDVLGKNSEVLSKNTDMLGRIDENLKYFRKDVVGDESNPGRLKVVETKLEDLEGHKNRQMGFIGAITVLWGILEAFLHLKK